MEKNLKCPMCDSSDFKEENGYYVCQICGNKIPIQTKTDKKPKKSSKKNEADSSSEKPQKPLPVRLIQGGLVLFGMGLVLLLGIIIVGLAVYGRVYFFDGYFITKLLTICCIIWMVGGFIELLVGLIMKFSKK